GRGVCCTVGDAACGCCGGTAGGVGRDGAAGVTIRGGAIGGGVLGATGGLRAGAAGFVSCTGGTAGFAGAAGCGELACCLARIAFSTSPGLEMCERSIFGFNPSGSERPERADFAPCPLPED